MGEVLTGENINTFNDKQNFNLGDLKEEIEINDSRIKEMFGIHEGKEYQRGDVIDFTFSSLDGKKYSFSFNTVNGSIIYDGRIIYINTFKDIEINKIFFDGKIVVYGKAGIVDGKMQSTYIETLKALDDIIKYLSNK